MTEAEKLKKVMARIKAIIEENDMGGAVVLHLPGHAEYAMLLSPSYSCATVAKDNRSLRFKAKLLQDFKGNKIAWEKKVTGTSKLFKMVGLKMGEMSLQMLDCGDLLDEKLGIYHGKEKDTTDLN
jgi:hypothetical protein